MLTTALNRRTTLWIVDELYATVYTSSWIKEVLKADEKAMESILNVFPVLPELIQSSSTQYPVILQSNHSKKLKDNFEVAVQKDYINGIHCFIIEFKKTSLREKHDWSDITLFEDSPIPIWDEDFSDIKNRLDVLKKQGVKNLREYLIENKDEYFYITSLLKINRINKAVVELNEAKTKEEVLNEFRLLTTKNSFDYVIWQLEAIWEGKTSCEFDATLITLKGNERFINLKWTVVIGNESTYKHIYLTTTDLTNRIKEENRYLQQANKEKETLLKEVHHRVKNNLQIITSLIRLQLGGTNNETAKSLLKISLSRINSIASVHELLYKSNQFSSIDYNEYIQHLVNTLVASMVENKEIDVQVEVDKVHIPLVSAIPLGLLVNEILTNSIKHAFTEMHSGKVFLQLKKLENGTILLRIGDNGKGFQLDNSEYCEDTLGLSLIENLAEQLSGELSRKTIDGTVYELRFSVNKDVKVS